MNKSKIIRRKLAALNLPQQVPNLMSHAKNIVLAMTGNTIFPEPYPTNVPSLATVTAVIASLDAAETTALSKAAGSVEARDAQKEILLKDLHALLYFVQGIADNDPTNAETIIKSAGMDIKHPGSRVKHDFNASHGDVSGTVKLFTRSAAKRASYKWQISTDNNTWTDLPVTIKCKTTVTGLTPGTLYYFRSIAVTKEGEGSVSQVVSIIVT